jgi:NAD(P)-dependent dehydrogenase (short-subunit alcohol dehydrogenase family)
MDIQGKVFVVTGGGNGMGREVVLGLLDRGARVAAVDVSPDGLAGTVSLAGPNTERLTTHQVNVTDPDAVNALPEAVIAAHGTVDGLLNVAGIIQKFVPFAELTTADIERVMNVNFWGVVNMVRAFLPILVTRPKAALVNVSSMGGFLPVPGQTIYGASKAAVKLFTEGLHAELMNGPVAVTVVFPGAIGTNISQNSGVDIPGMDAADASSHKTLAPSVAGRIIIEGMARGKYRVLVGGDATMLDRLTRLAPERAMKLIASQMADLLKH